MEFHALLVMTAQLDCPMGSYMQPLMLAEAGSEIETFQARTTMSYP